MFVCEKCVKNYIVSVHLELCPRSRGVCEDCRWIKTCYDLPHSSYYHKDSEYGRKLREGVRKLRKERDFNPSER